MNLFCSRDSEDEFLEAINTLERSKIKQNENVNKKHLKNNKNNNISKDSIILKEIIQSNNKEKAKNSKHKKKSTILEILEYPYNENDKNKSNRKSKINSNITDVNLETQLLMEYNEKCNENLYKGLNSYLNDNKVRFVNNEVNNLKKNMEKNINNFDIENNSKNSIIINDDYNSSISSSLYDLDIDEKIPQNEFSQLNNRKKDYINIKKNNTTNPHKLQNYRKYSIPFTKNRYSKDTNFTQEINIKPGKINKKYNNQSHNKKKIKEIPKVSKIEKINKNNIINRKNSKVIDNNTKGNTSKINKGNIIKSKTAFKKKKLVNQIQEKLSFNKNNISFNKQKNDENIISRKTNNNSNTNSYRKKQCKNILQKNNKKKNKYTKVIPNNKNTNINLFIITNTRNIFESGNTFNYIK